jgi:hypothetical protein
MRTVDTEIVGLRAYSVDGRRGPHPRRPASSQSGLAATGDGQCYGCLPTWGDQPSPDVYLKLTNALFALEIGVKNGKIKHFTAMIEELYLVLRYLNSNPLFVQLQLTKSLNSLAHALHDTSRGAKPPLIFKHRRGRSGAPTELSNAGVRAQINLMFKMLTTAEIKSADAAKWLASELKTAPGLHFRKAVTCTQIERWAREIGGKSLSGSDEIYHKLAAGLDRRGWSTDPAEARSRVRKYIRSLEASGF